MMYVEVFGLVMAPVNMTSYLVRKHVIAIYETRIDGTSYRTVVNLVGENDKTQMQIPSILAT